MQGRDVKVSIICITYNQVGYITDAIDSFLMQETNFDYEILVHDDASSDGTADIIREYERKYPDLIKPVYQRENQYSKGIKISNTFIYPILKGKYIAFCEGDDFWTDKHKLQKQYDYMEAHPDCSMCMHNGWNISKDGKHLHNSKPLLSQQCILGIKDAIQQLGIKVVTNSFFYRADIVKNSDYEFVKSAPTGDYVRVIECALQGYIFYDPETMSAHRAAAKNSLTETWGKDKTLWQSYIKKQIAMLDILNQETNYEYDDIINAEKTNQQFDNLIITHDSQALSVEPYKSMMKLLPVKQKIKYYFPRIFRILQKITGLFRRNNIGLVFKDLNYFQKHNN